MASMFLSLLHRTEKLPAKLLEQFSRSPSTSSTSSSSLSCSQIVEDLEKLRRRMKRIRALLEDAEEREIRENCIRLWLDELRDVAYDAEDVIEEFEYELLRHQLVCKEEEHAPITKERREINRKQEVSNSLITTPCAPLFDPLFQLQIVAKIERVNNLFDEIYNDGLALKLHEKDGQRPIASLWDPPPRKPMSCLVDEKGVHGREDDRHKVVKMLLSDVDDGWQYNNNVRVVSIVGMGGVGKTTLAQLVYKDNQVLDRFETRLWICVSEPFDVTRLTKDILEAIRGRPSEIEGFSALQESLDKELKGKMFFLVLDDVWNENQEHWESLMLPLLNGAEGSRVLITTRSENVSKISRVSAKNMYRLGCLSDEDSWSLFEQRAFNGKSTGDYPNLVRIGHQIVKKCNGLPLTVKTLAGLLFCEFREDRWEDILRSDLWELPEAEDHILSALKLSYHHLPSATKPCFAYCAVFPKNHNFDRDELVLMWMAQGYLKATPWRCMEDVGRRHFEDLLQRSIFEEHGQWYIMHDLTHDLALSVWGRKCCEVANGTLPGGEARHVSFECREDIMRLLSTGPVRGLTRLRTFGVFKVHPNYVCSTKVVNNLLLSMKYLHALDLRGLEISELPESVGNLKLLRYLGVGRSLLRKLPETLGNLLNLETLDVADAYGLKELPERVKELVNLRHLILHVADHRYGGLQSMPRGIGRLTQLRTMPRFVVGEGCGAAGIEELADLNNLQGKLEIKIRSLESWFNNKKEAILKNDNRKKDCILRNKHGLRSLALVFQNESNEELMESLQPHSKIKEVDITGYHGDRIPKWMEVPPGGAGASPFPLLEKLCLHFLQNVKTLALGAEDGGTFPCLRQLTIEYCPNLMCVKLRHLAALSELRINCCSKLIILDCYYDGRVSRRGSSSSPSFSGLQQQQPTVVDQILQMPHIHTIELRSCPNLEFLPAEQQQLQQSEFEFTGSDLQQQQSEFEFTGSEFEFTGSDLLDLQQQQSEFEFTGSEFEFTGSDLQQQQQEQQQLLLPPSLRRFEFTGSDLLERWVKRHVGKLVGSGYLHVVVERGGKSELRWEDDPPPDTRRQFPPAVPQRASTFDYATKFREPRECEFRRRPRLKRRRKHYVMKTLRNQLLP